MKIAVLSPGLGVHWRGYEVFALQLRQHMDRLGFSTLLIGSRSDLADGIQSARMLNPEGYLTKVMSRPTRFSAKEAAQSSFAVSASRLLRAFEPHVIVASESIVVRSLFALRNRARIITPGTSLILTNGGSRVPPFHYTDCVIHHAADLYSRALEEESVARHIWIPCPIEFPEMTQVDCKKAQRANLRAEYGIDQDRFVCVVIGSFDRSVKRIDAVARAIAEVRGTRKMHLVLVGPSQGAERGVLQECMALLGESLTITSMHPRQIGTALVMSDLHISASLNEGFGRVFLEAQAWMTPNLVHDTARTRFITGGAAEYVNMADNAALVKGLERIEASGPDINLEVARNNARRQSWVELSDRYATVFTELAGLQ